MTNDEAVSRILEFWKLEEYFTPSDYPELVKTVKEYQKQISFDTYYNEYNRPKLPLAVYKSHNEYLQNKKTPEDRMYNRVNIYCGRYKLSKFVVKMAEVCNLDMDKYQEINEISGRFYLFSVQIDLSGKITEEGVCISPFFYAVISIMQAKGINTNIKQEDIYEMGKDINEILKMNDVRISDFPDMERIKGIVFDKLGIASEMEVGLEAASEEIYACKALRKEDESTDFSSFYIDEIEYIRDNFQKNINLTKYVGSLLADAHQKIMIDNDIAAMQKWLEVDQYPLAKYPSRFSPTLMQQVAINIATSEKDRAEKIFSVNGPPGTGKTTLLKEIIASNVEKLAEVLISYGVEAGSFEAHKINSTSVGNYTDKYYEIPDEISKYGILVVSNNNGAVENVTLDLPIADSMKSNKTWTKHFDRNENSEVYFSKIADSLLGKEDGSWGLISARMGRKSYIRDVLELCRFKKANEEDDRLTLDSVKENSISWDEAVEQFKIAKNRVLRIREDIKKDKLLLNALYCKQEEVAKNRNALDDMILEGDEINEALREANNQLSANEKETTVYEEEIEYIKQHSSLFGRILILLHIGDKGKNVAKKQKEIDNLVSHHEIIKRNYEQLDDQRNRVSLEIAKQKKLILALEAEQLSLKEKVYNADDSLKSRYKDNLADKDFYQNIKFHEESQNACPWTFAEYDQAREELFYASLQVRKAFILESPYIKRNMYVYQSYVSGKLTSAEKYEVFPHLLNSLSIIIPVISSTFASIGRFLKHAGNQSLGMLVIDEAGQATPQSALGAIYRSRSAVVVGDPLQVEPVVTVPRVLIDILADSTGVDNRYKVIENSVQIFADFVNQFNGMIGDRQVGCPLVVHRRCIEPMFSISNMISYDNRMFNKTNQKDELIKPSEKFLIKESGWLQVEGPEVGGKNHFVELQGDKVCELLEKAMKPYENLFHEYDKIFIISPFKTVADSMRQCIIKHFSGLGYDKDLVREWTNKCIGTVHTFQGKDANEVLFVLGCSAKSSGAINWVVKKANIINVACTRAKYRILFIGDMNDWKSKIYFNEFIPGLIKQVEV